MNSPIGYNNSGKGPFRMVIYKKRLCIQTALLLVTVLLILTNIFIFLDVSILRVVFGLVFYSIVPGALILGILNLGEARHVVRLILSWGLSISFIIIVGLLINYLYPLLGYNTPLSINSLVITISIIVLILIGAVFWRNKSNSFIDLSNFNMDVREKVYLFLPAFFPFFAILGMYIMNTKDNNFMLMALHLLIVAYVIFISLNHNQVPERVYAPMIFLISISMVLLLGLRSNHIIGTDVHTEYYIFQQTVQNGQWDIILNSTLDACLNISILPAVYQSFLGIDPEYTFKILYPVLFSVCPLIIYIIVSKYIKSGYAFLASVFFLSQQSFLMTAVGPRSRLAVMFFALAIMVLFSDELDEINKRVLFITFTFSCIVSHYSTTYIYFFLLLGMLIGTKIIHWMCLSGRLQLIYKNQSKRFLKSSKINQEISCLSLKPHFGTGMLVFVFVAIFLWYSQITGVAFDQGVRFFERSLLSLQDFFIIESRHEGVQGALGQNLGDKGIPQRIEFVFSWLAIVFIGIGVLNTLARYRQCVALDDTPTRVPPSSLLYRRFDVEFFVASVICSAILVISVALPFVLKGYGMQRTFFQMMVILSLFFVIGGIAIAESLRFRKRGHLLVLFVLVTFFMCTTGVIYQILDEPRSMIFNSGGDSEFDIYYIYDQEILSARWINDYASEEFNIFRDHFGGTRLTSQGGVLNSRYSSDMNSQGGYIYLRYTNVVYKKWLASNYKWVDITNYRDNLGQRNLVYNNGGAEMWI